ncbi:MAG TPA: aminotransferase class I/II-fold pyridoxal phosphate-dependent enzyme [Myxococcota bacterium]|jgi:cystathionine gamma-synthase|nr:aminotransferase class I/II-fold pyridoxal phosphate-dependent enzyme [Myxococcota bacterium]
MSGRRDDRRPPPAGGPSTTAVHGGESRPRDADAVTTPIYPSATFTFRDTAELRDHMEGRIERLEYGRYGNPTVRAAERKLAAIEGAADALLCASGMAAVATAAFAVLGQGAHVVLTGDCYRRSRQLVVQLLARFGVTHTIVPAADVAAVEAALRPETKLVLAEAPSNPYLRVIDVRALAAVARARRVKTLVDATFATPVNLCPLALGADLVVHSATKYLGGHNDLLAGVLAGAAPLVSLLREKQGVLGAVADPHAAYLLLRGLKTLPLRVARQNETALSLARALEAHARVRRVHYPGLASHPDHATAAALMRGFGGVVSFELDADLDGTSRFVDALRIPQIAPSLGGVESLVEQPALMSYYELSPEEREAVGIRPSLVRLSVGLEDEADLRADLMQALAVTAA